MEYIIKQLLLHNWLVYVLALGQRYEGWYSNSFFHIVHI